MPCPSSTLGSAVPNTYFTNWSTRVSGPVGLYFLPDSLPELVSVVARATQAGHQLRVVGSGWGFEDIAYSPDWMVSLILLKRPLNTVTASALNSTWASRRAGAGDDVLFHVEAGATVADVNEYLAGLGLALPTLGGANGQAIAGVISTSTHGGDIEQPPFPDLVMAMHLVTVGGREVWVERASEPITDDVPLALSLACKDAEIIRNDDLFNAILVGFGRFGIVYSYVLRVRPAFRLAEWTVKLARASLTTALRQGIAAGTLLRPLLDVLPPPPAALGALDVGNPRGLEVVFDSLNAEQCFVKRRWMTNDGGDLNLANTQNMLCGLGARGVHDLAQTALFTLMGTPPWAVIPFFRAAVNVKQIELTARLQSNPTAGEMLALAVKAFWDLSAGAFIPHLAARQFGEAYANSMGDGKRGRSDLIISGFREQSLQACFRAVSIEPIFDAHVAGYVGFLDAVIAAAAGVKQAGYISLRWSAASRATLGMHNLASRHGVAIEVTSLKDLPDNETWMRTVESLALASGGRPHWGQQNRLTAAQTAQMFGTNLTNWRRALTALLGGSPVFSTSHTVQRGLEPESAAAAPTLFGRTAADVASAAVVPARYLLLS